MWSVLRVYSWIFESVLCLMGLLLATFALASHHLNVEVGWLPWRGASAPVWIALVAVLGLVCVGVAVLGRVRILLILFSGTVVFFLIKGLFLDSQYTFAGPADTRNAVILVLSALLAFAGALPLGRAKHSRAR